jgi:hypothetical protein
MTDQIVFETILNLQIEAIPFQLNTQPLDTHFFSNDKTVININSNENDSFSFPILSKIDLIYFSQNQKI